MILSGKAATAVTVGDLQALLDGAVPEGQHLDYKQQLPAARDPGRPRNSASISPRSPMPTVVT